MSAKNAPESVKVRAAAARTAEPTPAAETPTYGTVTLTSDKTPRHAHRYADGTVRYASANSGSSSEITWRKAPAKLAATFKADAPAAKCIQCGTADVPADATGVDAICTECHKGNAKPAPVFGPFKITQGRVYGERVYFVKDLAGVIRHTAPLKADAEAWAAENTPAPAAEPNPAPVPADAFERGWIRYGNRHARARRDAQGVMFLAADGETWKPAGAKVAGTFVFDAEETAKFTGAPAAPVFSDAPAAEPTPATPAQVSAAIADGAFIVPGAAEAATRGAGLKWTKREGGGEYATDTGWTVSRGGAIAPGGRGGRREIVWHIYPTTDFRPARGLRALPGFTTRDTLAEARKHVATLGQAPKVEGAPAPVETVAEHGLRVDPRITAASVASVNEQVRKAPPSRRMRADAAARAAGADAQAFTSEQPVMVRLDGENGWRRATYVRPSNPGQDASAGFHIVAVDGMASVGNVREIHPENIRPADAPAMSPTMVYPDGAAAARNFRALADATTGKVRAFWLALASVAVQPA